MMKINSAHIYFFPEIKAFNKNKLLNKRMKTVLVGFSEIQAVLGIEKIDAMVLFI